MKIGKQLPSFITFHNAELAEYLLLNLVLRVIWTKFYVKFQALYKLSSIYLQK